MAYGMSSIFDKTGQNSIWGTSYNSNNGVNTLGLGTNGFSSNRLLDVVPQKAESISGYGRLTWLSAKAGLITCKDEMVISFQLKDFCDQLVNDLTSVLRVGFTLAFQASLNETNEYTATLVQPLYGNDADVVFMNSKEVDLDGISPSPTNARDLYDLNNEGIALPALLSIFQRHGTNKIQLSSLHSQLGQSNENEMLKYVGTSSLKRRHFIERRSHIFILKQDDSVQLQHPNIYLCVLSLASYLLRRGGVTAIQSLYDYYISAEMPAKAKSNFGEGRQEFLNLIIGHPWIFALFPNRTYVSVRRNLPHIDISIFCKLYKGENPQSNGISAQYTSMPHNNNAAPRTIVRSLSAQQPFGGHSLEVNPVYNNEFMMADVMSVGTLNKQYSPQMFPSFPNRDVYNSKGVIGSGLGKLTSNVAVQTEPMRADSGACLCCCTCRSGNAMSRISGGSASPPSLESTSPSTGDRLSPGSGPAPIGDKPPIETKKYYDPFGTDLLVTLNSFHL
ncbi:unnamed protein product [Auanema sp. JU1783]|nr:unnamed protein product [Auanema sp. JU1783]